MSVISGESYKLSALVSYKTKAVAAGGLGVCTMELWMGVMWTVESWMEAVCTVVPCTGCIAGISF